MTMLRELVTGTIGMFVGDVEMTIALLGLVAATAGLIHLAGVQPLVGGTVLLTGALLVLVASVVRAGRERRPAA